MASIKNRLLALPITQLEVLEAQNLLFGEAQDLQALYDPQSHPRHLVEHFRSVLEELGETERIENERGDVKYVRRPIDPPTLAGFAARNDVSVSTLRDWAQRFPEFAHAMEIAHAIQEQIIVSLGATTGYDSKFAQLMCKNYFGWQDRVENTHRVGVILRFDDEDSRA